ncbi:hypothetical protein MY10362_000679 [Beauveria mimosiformis]
MGMLLDRPQNTVVATAASAQAASAQAASAQAASWPAATSPLSSRRGFGRISNEPAIALPRAVRPARLHPAALPVTVIHAIRSPS